MNPRYLRLMSAEEVDEYGRVIGVDTSSVRSADDKARIIEARRERAVTVRAVGVELTVRKKALSDKRVTDLLARGTGRTDAETEELMRLLVGDRQMDELVEACTDEDGTVDNAALALAFVKVMTSNELKNL